MNAPSGELIPDRGQLDVFVKAMFRHAKAGAYASLRAFPDNDADTKPFRISPVMLTERADSLDFLVSTAENDAYRAANDPKRIVFCPPLATFNNKDRAKEQDLAEGLALSVECDEHPQAARALLEQLLGPATLVVASGGNWIDPATGEIRPRFHLHWRLRTPARGEDLHLLKQARAFATAIVGGDPSNKPIVHPIRWPGSWHRKAEPVLCAIDTAYSEVEIDLKASFDILKVAAPKTNGVANGSANGSGNPFSDYGDRERPTDDAVLILDILSGQHLHDSIAQLASRFIGRGMHDGAAVNFLRDLLNRAPEPHDARWRARYDDISRAVSTARGKYARQLKFYKALLFSKQRLMLGSSLRSCRRVIGFTQIYFCERF
jgi:hypothetical protein